MPQKILIIGPSWVGDMVMAQTLFKLIKARDPDAIIHVLAPAWTFSLLSRMPEVAEAIEITVGHGELKLKSRYQLAKQLRALQYDQAIVLPNSFKAALIPFLAGIPKRTGWKGEWRYGLLNDIRHLDKKRYPLMIEQYMALGLPANEPLPTPYPYPSFPIATASQEATLAKHKPIWRGRPILALAAGAEYGPAKRWPEEYFAAVANQKLEEGWDVWLFGSPKDKPVTDKIMTLTNHRCENIAGKPVLAETIDLLSLTHGLITNDSGLMHIAAALQKPVIAIYGSTSPAFTPPLSEAATVLKLNLDCQPCFARECPLGHHRCMRELSPDQVLAAISKWGAVMRVLLIKTSSMGDVIHTLPALTDASKALPGITFDWVVENAFAEIPDWHPNVGEVIPIALRRWRKGIFSRETREGFSALHKRLQENRYDFILDAQGLVKSAFLTFFAKGTRVGLDWKSARESFASLAYQRKYTVNFHQHAILRMRQLFSQALGYPMPESAPQFALDLAQFKRQTAAERYVVFLHGTTWVTKQWPETYWMQLAALAAAEGYRIKIGGGNSTEVDRAMRIAKQNENIDLVPYLDISQMAALLVNSQGAVAVDTGFGHLAGALDVPVVSIYGSTNAAYTGALGKSSVHLSSDFPCAPCLSRECTFRGTASVTPACYTAITPARVWSTLKSVL